MYFKGTIIITDPCYVIREHNEITEDDWDACDCGRAMEALGIKHYITESTIYGDWGCTTYQIQKNPKEIVDKLAAASDDEYVEVGVEVKDLGRFCADAGLVSVFYLDEILKYNPEFDKWAKEHDWCVTTIPDFDGEIEYYVDTNEEAHIVGKGNINFFTTQTSL